MSEQHFLQPRPHWFYNFAIVIAGLLVFVFVPLFFLSPEQTQQFLNNGRELQVLADVTVLVFLFYIGLAAYYWALNLIRLKEIAATHIMFVFCWVSFSGFLFPLTTAGGMFELRHAPNNMQNFVIVVILSTIFAVLFVSKYSKVAQVFMTVFLVVSIIPILPRTFSHFEKRKPGAQIVKFSNDRNLLLVGFDGIPGHVVKKLLTSRPEIANSFKDFTFFENTYSSAPATQGSLQGVVYGNYNFTNMENRTWLDAGQLYFNNNDKVNFTSAFHYNVYNKTGKKISAGQYGVDEQRNELFELYRNVVSRITSKYGVSTMDVIDRLFFADRKGKFFFTVDGFDQVVDSFQLGGHRPTIFFSHFTFTHWPPRVDEKCTDRLMDKRWFQNHQNENGIEEGAICGLKKYSELISKLKIMGIYDNTTIVFLSDHGMLWRFYKNPPHNLKINNGRALGFDRYLPFMMIKPEESISNKLTFSNRFVILDDLATTLCNLFENPRICEQYPGLNILDDNDVAPDEFYIHVVKDENSSWSAIDHKAVKLPRGIPLLDAMKASPEITLSDPE